MSKSTDWLSHLLDIVPVRGRLDLRCFYGAPWRIDRKPAAAGEIPYHAVLSGSAMLENPGGGPATRLTAGDVLLLPHGSLHALHDGSNARPVPAQSFERLNLAISENAGTGDRLDMLCGHFILAPPHDRLLRDYLPSQLIVRVAAPVTAEGELGTGMQIADLLSLMRIESAAESLGGRAMLNALSTALFTLVLRLAGAAEAAPSGLLAVASNQRLAPALNALFQEPGRAWTLPDLARLCHMSRATLARHFQERLGRSANELLTDIRMALAANALRKPTASMGAVAEMVGYQSEAAFQRTFKQHMGVTPAQWRRTQARAEQDV